MQRAPNSAKGRGLTQLIRGKLEVVLMGAGLAQAGGGAGPTRDAKQGFVVAAGLAARASVQGYAEDLAALALRRAGARTGARVIGRDGGGKNADPVGHLEQLGLEVSRMAGEGGQVDRDLAARQTLWASPRDRNRDLLRVEGGGRERDGKQESFGGQAHERFHVATIGEFHHPTASASITRLD